MTSIAAVRWRDKKVIVCSDSMIECSGHVTFVKSKVRTYPGEVRIGIAGVVSSWPTGVSREELEVFSEGKDELELLRVEGLEIGTVENGEYLEHDEPVAAVGSGCAATFIALTSRYREMQLATFSEAKAIVEECCDLAFRYSPGCGGKVRFY